MSLQIHLIHARKGPTPPALHAEEATRDMATGASLQHPMSEHMRACFTATYDRDVTRVFPKQDLRSGGALIFLHGGVCLFLLVDGRWGIVEGLINRIDLPVIIPGYPLTPEHTATEVFDFVQPITGEVQAKFGRIVVLGDSTGGDLVLSLAMQYRDAGKRQVDGLALYTPRVDMTMTSPTIEDVQCCDKILRASELEWVDCARAGDPDPANWWVNPLYSDPVGPSPMRVFQGDADIPGPDTIESARKTACAGVDVHLRMESDGSHVYMPLVPVIPEAEAVLDHSARFVSGILTQP